MLIIFRIINRMSIGKVGPLHAYYPHILAMVPRERNQGELPFENVSFWADFG